MGEDFEMWRLPQVIAATGVRRSSIYQKVKDGLLPPPVTIGLRAVAWPAAEIRTIIRTQITGQGQDAIKILVTKLVSERQNIFHNSGGNL